MNSVDIAVFSNFLQLYLRYDADLLFNLLYPAVLNYHLANKVDHNKRDMPFSVAWYSVNSVSMTIVSDAFTNDNV